MKSALRVLKLCTSTLALLRCDRSPLYADTHAHKSARPMLCFSHSRHMIASCVRALSQPVWVGVDLEDQRTEATIKVPTAMGSRTEQDACKHGKCIAPWLPGREPPEFVKQRQREKLLKGPEIRMRRELQRMGRHGGVGGQVALEKKQPISPVLSMVALKSIFC